MKITVADARALSDTLKEGADRAEQAGEAEFDLTASLKDSSKEALDSLQAAIDAVE